jgi:hypothetical protein
LVFSKLYLDNEDLPITSPISLLSHLELVLSPLYRQPVPWLVQLVPLPQQLLVQPLPQVPQQLLVQLLLQLLELLLPVTPFRLCEHLPMLLYDL